MDHEHPDPASLPTQPQYAQLRVRHRPSPKGEQRLWLYQCAVKSCSRGEMKIAGTSRPKGRDVPSCIYCGGKMHWKGTERDPAAQSTGGGGGGGSGLEGPDSDLASNTGTLSVPPTSSQTRRSHSPPAQTHPQHFHPAASFTPVLHHPSSPAALAHHGAESARLTPVSTPTASVTAAAAAAADASPSSSSGENRGGRPWEL